MLTSQSPPTISLYVRLFYRMYFSTLKAWTVQGKSIVGPEARVGGRKELWKEKMKGSQLK